MHPERLELNWRPVLKARNGRLTVVSVRANTGPVGADLLTGRGQRRICIDVVRAVQPTCLFERFYWNKHQERNRTAFGYNNAASVRGAEVFVICSVKIMSS